MTRTRFAELGYERHGPALWRVVSVEDGKAVGPHYRTRAELLADLDRYASLYGCADAAPFVPQDAGKGGAS